MSWDIWAGVYGIVSMVCIWLFLTRVFADKPLGWLFHTFALLLLLAALGVHQRYSFSLLLLLLTGYESPELPLQRAWFLGSLLGSLAAWVGAMIYLAAQRRRGASLIAYRH